MAGERKPITYEEGVAQIPKRELPPFWFGDVKGLAKRWRKLERGKVSVIAKSPGRRPVHLITYGTYEPVERKANFNSAVGGRDVSAYMRKSDRKKPVVYFVGPVHGHEVEGLTGLVNLVHVMETGKDLRGKDQSVLRELGDQCRLLIVPEGNPDGIARFEPRCSQGEASEGRFPWGMGTLSDGTPLVWPESKLIHPMVGEEVGFLGCYFNDAGVNPMHDDFMDPMSEEAPAILKVAKEEGPDLAVSLHSYSFPPGVLRPAYLPMEEQEEIRAFAERYHVLLEECGLPHAQPPKPQAEQGDPPAPFNLVSALYHISGAPSFVFECPHGFTDEKYCQVSLEEILDMQLTLYEAMMKWALEKKAATV